MARPDTRFSSPYSRPAEPNLAKLPVVRRPKVKSYTIWFGDVEERQQHPVERQKSFEVADVAERLFDRFQDQLEKEAAQRREEERRRQIERHYGEVW